MNGPVSPTLSPVPRPRALQQNECNITAGYDAPPDHPHEVGQSDAQGSGPGRPAHDPAEGRKRPSFTDGSSGGARCPACGSTAYGFVGDACVCDGCGRELEVGT
jgi:hypothetical protein